MTLIRLIGAAAAILTFMCGSIGPNAGSETTSGVKIAAEGTTIRVTTASAATVILFDAGFAPGDTQKTADTATVDGSGRVAFTGLQAGTYNVFVYPAGPSKGAVVRGIPIGSNFEPAYADSSAFGALRTIAGIVMRQGLPDSVAQVYIIGSPFYAQTDSQGKFMFHEVPAGSYTIVARESMRAGTPEDTVSVDLARLTDSMVNVTLELP